MNVAARFDAAPGADWEANGWELIPGFLGPEEIALLQAESDRLCGNTALFDERGAVPNSSARSDRLDPVIDVSPMFAALARR